MIRHLTLVFFLSIIFTGFAQQGDGGEPKGHDIFINSAITVANYTFNKPDVAQLRAEDEINDAEKKGPWRFGYNHETSLDLYNSGSWITLPNGDQLWLMKITSEEALTINLTFSNTTIPEGNELYIYNPKKNFILGKFTEKHIYKGELGTELVPGNTVLVEYYVPAINSNHIGNVEISRVTHGYRNASEYYTKAFGSSQNCNMNVNCPDGAPYKDQRNSTLMIVVGGSGICTGALINNTEFDGKPYVLTANHCYRNDYASWVFRFNWQADACNNPGGSPSFQSLSGSMMRARRNPSDFMLLEISGGLENGTVPASYSPYFAGWDKRDLVPQSTFSIHHPSGDIKKIAFDDKPAIALTAMNSSELNSSWKVIWDRNTTTEGGSSGAPLFNGYGRIIGQLWGGNASCQNTGTGRDFYGRLYNSWEPTGSSSASQLKHWLDPTDSNTEAIEGYDPHQPQGTNDAAALEIIRDNNVSCTHIHQPKVVISNNGNAPLTSLVIDYSYNGNTQSINWSGNLLKHQVDTVTLMIMYNNNGNNTLDVELHSPNGQIDDDMSNNLLSTSFISKTDGASVAFDFYLGCYPYETSWELRDSDENIIYSGGNYPEASNSNHWVSETFCLDNGCYELILKDTGGDGVSSSYVGGCDYDGSMTLKLNANNEILASLPMSQANFGSEKKYDFCIQNASITTEEKTHRFSLYPNPTTGTFTVQTDIEGKKTIEITNLEGRKINTYRIVEKELTIREPNLAPGVYLITVSNDNTLLTKKIIIE